MTIRNFCCSTAHFACATIHVVSQLSRRSIRSRLRFVRQLICAPQRIDHVGRHGFAQDPLIQKTQPSPQLSLAQPDRHRIAAAAFVFHGAHIFCADRRGSWDSDWIYRSFLQRVPHAEVPLSRRTNIDGISDWRVRPAFGKQLTACKHGSLGRYFDLQNHHGHASPFDLRRARPCLGILPLLFQLLRRGRARRVGRVGAARTGAPRRTL